MKKLMSIVTTGRNVYKTLANMQKQTSW